MFSWINFLTYAVITAATPGPNNIMSMSNAGRLGFRKSLPFNWGILAGFLIVMLISTYFCSLLSSAIPVIKTPMLIVGAVYLLYFAWKTFKSSPNMEENHTRSGFLSGLSLQFINPKLYIYCVISMEAYILPYFSHNAAALFLFAILLGFIGFVSPLCWAIFGSIFKIIFSKYAKITNTVMALLLVYCAVSLLLE